ncbi:MULTISPECIES: helix-turn-helix domain-containing protein [Kocuria]|jgi:excisionase family DNA binding protein|uniref:DNA-binding protein n=1 Tax=Kocuria rosea TaxID=1275 RepID=A0A4S3QAV2_KOCRO|nr:MULTISPECIES: helix-turn-helix domain-containing protein [Kocuria]MCC5781716.1 DNA-binding protein [Kocuria sp. CCUG 69068]MEB2619890.1 helix-turn-helix domain-containing protein [Kocuria rosea]NVC25292.1 helix-turn-helix domain-containing protein [Kocuria salina]PAU89247.1 excisionase [Kocuria sp. WN036]TDL46479.1 DNA-binding protein [Kocuria rosea]
MRAQVIVVSDALDRLFEGLPERLTVDQLAQVLGLGDRTITYRWLRDGIVPAIKLGKTWLILRDDIKEHLRSQYNVPHSTDNDGAHTNEE